MLDKYNFSLVEKEVGRVWLNNGLHSEYFDKKNSILFDGPPPHVSGELHMGHVFSYSHHAILITFYRQRGVNLVYGLGLDNNGVPTERLTEKENKVSALKMPREDFIDLCKKTITRYKPRYVDLFKRLGIIFNVDKMYDTLDVRDLVHQSFNRLVEKGDIYQAKGPVLWDVAFQTAISQSELEEKEQETQMNYIKFQAVKLKDGIEKANFSTYSLNSFEIQKNIDITIATTRPELLPACSAVFYHPDDARYNNLGVEYILVPVVNRLVKFIPDKDVKIDKGSGLVMCCTFGDIQDIDWWKRHNLNLMMMINKYGKIEFSDAFDKDNLNGFLVLEGLNIVKAREKALEILSDYVIKQEKIINKVKISERSKKTVELIVASQWFVKVLKYREDLRVLADKIEWYPAHMKNKFLAWLDAVSWDWCISRQRVFGIPIPGDSDVFDTWFTSAITNLIVKQKYQGTDVFNDEYVPSYIRGQAHEIIRTWTFYSILIHYLHFQDIPWKKIVVSGWCLAEDKTKMSKSKGNVLCPEAILNKHGVDAVRYWASSAKLGNDFRYSEQIVKNGKRVVNKLWNVVKLFQIAVPKNCIKDLHNSVYEDQIDMKNMYDIDIWILYKLQELQKEYDNFFKKMDYFSAKLILEEFFMGVFCDFYLEIIKDRLYNDQNRLLEGDKGGVNAVGQNSAQVALYVVLKQMLYLWSPIIPYVSEYLYQVLFANHKNNFIMKVANLNYITGIVKKDVGDIIIDIIEVIRKYKTDNNLALNQKMKGMILDSSFESKLSVNVLIDLRNVLNCEKIVFEVLNDDKQNKQSKRDGQGDMDSQENDQNKLDNVQDDKIVKSKQGIVIRVL